MGNQAKGVCASGIASSAVLRAQSLLTYKPFTKSSDETYLFNLY